MCVDFNFQSLGGDPEGWTATYNQVIKGLFNPWSSVFAKFDFLIRYVSAERRRADAATKKFCNMLDELANKKRKDILAGVNTGVAESEKDLLTLMIEADLRDNKEETISNLELRVS